MPSPGPLTCALCGASVRSVYSLPGDTKNKLCSKCFFGAVPVTAEKRRRGAA